MPHDQMTLEKALITWGYPTTRKKKKQLILLCNLHPELFDSTVPLANAFPSNKPYLPTHRTKDIYTHIVYAIQDNAHMYADSFHIDNAHLKEYIRQLSKANLITKLPHKKKVTTENYAITIEAITWLKKRPLMRIKYLAKAISPLKPDQLFNINFMEQ